MQSMCYSVVHHKEVPKWVHLVIRVFDCFLDLIVIQKIRQAAGHWRVRPPKTYHLVLITYYLVLIPYPLSQGGREG